MTWRQTEPAAEDPQPASDVGAPDTSAQSDAMKPDTLPEPKLETAATAPKEETEKHEKPPMDAEAVRTAAQKASDVLSQLLLKPLEYEVREALPCYSDPDTNSKEIRSLAVGHQLQGYPGGGWVKLQKGWAHIGRSLALTCLVPTIRARYLEAIHLTWPGFSGLLKPGVKVPKVLGTPSYVT